MNYIPRRHIRTSPFARNANLLKAKLSNLTNSYPSHNDIKLLMFFNSHRPILIPAKPKKKAAYSVEKEFSKLYLDRNYEMDVMSFDSWVKDKNSEELVDLSSDIFYASDNLSAKLDELVDKSSNEESMEASSFFLEESITPETKQIVNSSPLLTTNAKQSGRNNLAILEKEILSSVLKPSTLVGKNLKKNRLLGFWQPLENMNRSQLSNYGLLPYSNVEVFRLSYRYGRRICMPMIKVSSAEKTMILPTFAEKDFRRFPISEIINLPSISHNVTIQAKKLPSILSIRRKKMNKHKWKKLRRKLRDSTRYNKSKRKKNRERLMEEAKELGIEF